MVRVMTFWDAPSRNITSKILPSKASKKKSTCRTAMVIPKRQTVMIISFPKFIFYVYDTKFGYLTHIFLFILLMFYINIFYIFDHELYATSINGVLKSGAT